MIRSEELVQERPVAAAAAMKPLLRPVKNPVPVRHRPDQQVLRTLHVHGVQRGGREEGRGAEGLRAEQLREMHGGIEGESAVVIWRLELLLLLGRGVAWLLHAEVLFFVRDFMVGSSVVILLLKHSADDPPIILLEIDNINRYITIEH